VPAIKPEHYIVAIGASAGGLEAIHEFFDHMPESSNFSFVVIQHLSPDYKSLLVELVSKHTHMKVFEAANDMAVQPDCVYIIPNNKLMTISRGRLKLAEKSKVKSPNNAIDTFLHTLARDKKKNAIAIILSGTGSDGTRGIESIKECGGIVMVQDPTTAKFDGMPNSAIASGNTDFILPPETMHQELYNHVNETPVKVLNNGKVDDHLLDEIFKLIYTSGGHDFNLYKTPTIIRRISKRMSQNNITRLDDYVTYLQQHNDEVKQLGKDFLIGVTKFFRDPAAFEALEQKVIPGIVENKAENDVIKVWICACSTGEEAYSIAITIDKYLRKHALKLELKVFATDVDEESIDIAARNNYPENLVKDIPADILDEYFEKQGKFYAIIPRIRKQIVFARHNVIKAPPFIKNDLVSCRNMLIYINNILQQKILSTFHFSLNQGGYLFLGSSETAGSIKDGLEEINSKWKIYRKVGSINYAATDMYRPSPKLSSDKKESPFKAELRSQKDIEADFREIMTEDLGYVAVYIDRNYEIKETIGNFGRFLSLPEKKLNFNLLKMVSPQLSIQLNSAIRKSWKENKKVLINGVRTSINDQDSFVDITIKPAIQGKPYTMVVFGASWNNDAAKDDMLIHIENGSHTDNFVAELEAELHETRNNLQMAVEEMETTNEELQSSNEELLSSNEELQSSNEELQSLNEELHTLNAEHQLKIKELVELNDDLNNYFRSSNIGQIFLDSQLKVRKFNPAAIRMVNLIESDIGRPINHISTNLRYENLIADIRAIIANNQTLEKEIVLSNGTRSLMRIMPFIRQDKQIDGVVITFVDISTITELSNIINGIFNASVSVVVALKSVRDHSDTIADFSIITANNNATKYLDIDENNIKGLLIKQKATKLIAEDLFQKYCSVVRTGAPLETEYQDSNGRWQQVVAVKMQDGLVANYTDITDRKHAEQKFRNNFNELVKTREDLKRLNKELEGKIDERTRKLTDSEERFTLLSKSTNDTIWDWDMVNNRIWRSDNFTAMFGYEKDAERGNLSFWFSNIHPDDRQRVQDSVYETINSGAKQWSAEYKFLRSDGKYASLLDRGHILHDEYNTPYRMLGSIVDVTKLVEAEKRIQSSELKFRKIFDANMIGMLFSDMDERVLEANDAYLQMLGYNQDDLKTNAIDWGVITPLEFKAVSQWAVNQLKDSGVCPAFEKEYVRKDGKRVAVLMGAARLDVEGEAYAVMYVIDITDKKESEQKKKELQGLIRKQQDEFYSIFMNAPALITIRRGPELRYEFVNKAVEEFNGRKDYVGKTDDEVYPEWKDDHLKAIESTVVKNGEVLSRKAYHITRLDQRVNEMKDSWFDFIYTPVYNEEGKVDGIASFGFDVTDMIKAQQSIKQLMQKKDEFMSIASHELKTPITSVKASLQIVQRLVQKYIEVGNIHQFIEKANKQIGKLTILVDDLLDVTKIHAGKLLFDTTRFNVAEVINECIGELSDQSTNKHQFILKGDANVDIFADRNRLEQVINNFLSNAIKYSPEADKVILTASTNNDGIFKLTVQDFGIGIPKDKVDYVFDRFFRVQESSQKFSGLGLGLYISQEIIKRHGGRIGVVSEEGKGSTFWFTIPVNGIESEISSEYDLLNKL
jgi:two-component system CheB/CheR fusion protein